MNLTAEQTAILDLAWTTNESFIIDAKAGSGKTSTLMELLDGALRGTTLLMAFNRAIADECKMKAANKLSFEAGLNVSISTVHSHGLSAFRRAGAKPKTLSGKLSFILKDMLTIEYNRDNDIWRNMSKVSHLCSYAKSAGFGLESINERFPAITQHSAWEELAEHFGLEEDLVGDTTLNEIISLAIQLLGRSNRQTNSIDFDDMIYLPLLLNMSIPTYDNVLIDEAQDINATRRELAFRSMKPGGRLIAVGDPNQAIYGFTGADAESLQNVGRRIGQIQGNDNLWHVMPLSICWRCDDRIIREAQKLVPEIKARPNAPEGHVSSIPYIADINGAQGGSDFFSLVQPGDAVLCRLNKPNVATCLGLLRRGKPAKIEGRDLGKRLEHHVTKASDGYAFQSLADTLIDLDMYEEQEVGRLVAKNKSESTIALLEDEIDAARLVLEKCIEDNPKAQWTAFTTLLAQLFGDDVSSKSTITLSSVHKAKGREWKRVFILGRFDYMPFHRATQEWEQEQEQNLIYVAITRAEQALFYVTGVQSAIDKGEHREVRKQPPSLEEANALNQEGYAKIS